MYNGGQAGLNWFKLVCLHLGRRAGTASRSTWLGRGVEPVRVLLRCTGTPAPPSVPTARVYRHGVATCDVTKTAGAARFTTQDFVQLNLINTNLHKNVANFPLYCLN